MGLSMQRLLLLFEMSGKHLQPILQGNCWYKLIERCEGLRISEKGDIFRRASLMMNLWFQPKDVSGPRHNLVDAFTVSQTQIHTTSALLWRAGQHGQQRLYGIPYIHSINIIFSVPNHRKMRITLKGKAAHQLCIQLARWLIGTIGSEEAHNRRLLYTVTVSHKCLDILFRR